MDTVILQNAHENRESGREVCTACINIFFNVVVSCWGWFHVFWEASCSPMRLHYPTVTLFFLPVLSLVQRNWLCFRAREGGKYLQVCCMCQVERGHTPLGEHLRVIQHLRLEGILISTWFQPLCSGNGSRDSSEPLLGAGSTRSCSSARCLEEAVWGMPVGKLQCWVLPKPACVGQSFFLSPSSWPLRA